MCLKNKNFVTLITITGERNPMQIYYDNDANLDLLSDKTVAVIGYGSQGHAHSLNLKESGVNVVVGLRPGSSSKVDAEAAGLKVLEVSKLLRLGIL